MNEGTGSFDVVAQGGGRKGTWKVILSPESLTVTAADGSESFEILRDDAEEKIEIRGASLSEPFLVIHVPKQIMFKMQKTHSETVKQWMGPPTLKGLKIALKRRLKWSIPLAILFIVTSIPWSGNPEAGIETIPFDPVSLFLGVVLLGIVLLSKIRPKRNLFLVDASWFFILAVLVTVKVIRGDSLLWLIALVLLLFGAFGGISEYKRFASMTNQTDMKVKKDQENKKKDIT
jgi:hypothetical protein